MCLPVSSVSSGRNGKRQDGVQYQAGCQDPYRKPAETRLFLPIRPYGLLKKIRQGFYAKRGVHQKQRQEIDDIPDPLIVGEHARPDKTSKHINGKVEVPPLESIPHDPDSEQKQHRPDHQINDHLAERSPAALSVEQDVVQPFVHRFIIDADVLEKSLKRALGKI